MHWLMSYSQCLLVIVRFVLASWTLGMDDQKRSGTPKLRVFSRSVYLIFITLLLSNISHSVSSAQGFHWWWCTKTIIMSISRSPSWHKATFSHPGSACVCQQWKLGSLQVLTFRHGGKIIPGLWLSPEWWAFWSFQWCFPEKDVFVAKKSDPFGEIAGQASLPVEPLGACNHPAGSSAFWVEPGCSQNNEEDCRWWSKEWCRRGRTAHQWRDSLQRLCGKVDCRRGKGRWSPDWAFSSLVKWCSL